MPADGPRTYYVSPSGSDTVTGMDPAQPLRTLGAVSDQSLRPGDSVLLERGATFSGRLDLRASGTEAQPIVVSSFGTGAQPRVTGGCIRLAGDHLTVQDVHVWRCDRDGVSVYGSYDTIRLITGSHNVRAVVVHTAARGTRVVRNRLRDNTRLAPNTPGPTDDYGAIAVAVSGDDTLVARNVMSNNWAPSPDFGTDGSAVEIFGAIGTRVHRDVGHHNRAFTELGDSRTTDTTFTDNRVTSNLRESEFLITRGNEDPFGPVAGTLAVNNYVKLDGRGSRGYVCYANCSPSLFGLYDNVLDVAGEIGLLDGTMAGGNNTYCRGALTTALLEGDRYFASGCPSTGP